VRVAKADLTGSVVEDSWTTKEPIPRSDFGIKAAAVDEKIYVIGDTMNYEFDPAGNSWTAKMPIAHLQILCSNSGLQE